MVAIEGTSSTLTSLNIPSVTHETYSNFKSTSTSKFPLCETETAIICPLLPWIYRVYPSSWRGLRPIPWRRTPKILRPACPALGRRSPTLTHSARRVYRRGIIWNHRPRRTAAASLFSRRQFLAPSRILRRQCQYLELDRYQEVV